MLSRLRRPERLNIRCYVCATCNPDGARWIAERFGIAPDGQSTRREIVVDGRRFRLRFTEHIDTTTPAGRMMMQMVGAFAEFERAMIRERTSAGLAAARAEGRIGGRRKKLDDTKRREIAEAVVSGRKTAAQMARMFGVSPPTVSRIVAAHVAGLA
jgi:DNA invertase Pin-like site-specific DNA recombinase